VDFKSIIFCFLFLSCGVSKPSYFPSTELKQVSKTGHLTIHHFEQGSQLSKSNIESIKSDVLFKIIFEGFRGKYSTNPLLNKTITSKPFEELKNQFIDKLTLAEKKVRLDYTLYVFEINYENLKTKLTK
tara:strand:- start:117 stop:503 length:387 start_codon:yes stop_codon:yes gene_type:complete